MLKYIFAVIMLYAASAYSGVLTGEIKGKVADEEGKPVVNVYVVINEPGVSLTTDTEGTYYAADIPYGHYHLTFSKTGYISKTIEIDLRAPIASRDVELDKSLIQTATIDVTSSFEAQDISQSTFSISTLNLKNLIQDRSHNLSSTIAEIPGVNSVTTGIGLGKPVIRGMTSNSVLIVHDGVKHESQQWGDEHAPEISVYDLDRIEILRGPASLLYGSEGIGGVVNIISKPLQYSGNNKTIFYGGLDLGGFSVNKEGTGNLMLGAGLENLGIKGHIGIRNSGNVNTPDGIFLANTLNPAVKDTIHGGELSNSGAKEIEGGLSLGIRNKLGYIEAGYEYFGREIQMHDPDPMATGNQKLNTQQFELSENFQLSRNFHLEPIISYQMQDRKEYETTEDKEIDNPNLYWKLKAFQGDVRLHNDFGENFSGTAGLSYSNTDNKSLGIEKLIPNFVSDSYGLYLFEKYNMNRFTLSLGGRYDAKKINIQYTDMTNGAEVKFIVPRVINMNAFSGSAGIVYRPNDDIDIFSNIGRGWRAPSEFELYVDGVHEGTSRVELGIITQNPDAEPTPETSLNIDLGVRARLKNLNAEISLFNNIIDNFVYPSPAGLTDSASGLPVYLIKQDRSFFRGVEYSFQYQPAGFILLTLNGDYVFTKNDATGSPLPFTPPMKNIFGVKLQKQNLGGIYNPYIKLSIKIVSPQNDVDPLETKTDGYTLINAGAGFDMIFSKTVASIDINVENLGNLKYVDHLSRYKTFALNPGRSFNLKITVPFQL
ncbi:MAG: TonB-dependent receptor [Bacteroidetes bacterium]|nr:TonB-dependent receptor [Bacteroidota bacterium]